VELKSSWKAPVILVLPPNESHLSAAAQALNRGAAAMAADKPR
jgi:hypothetical protein